MWADFYTGEWGGWGRSDVVGVDGGAEWAGWRRERCGGAGGGVERGGLCEWVGWDRGGRGRLCFVGEGI